jgi:hypothetical protein
MAEFRRDADEPRREPGAAMDSRQVCDIVAAIAAEVLSEIRSGAWRPPAAPPASPRLIFFNVTNV